MPANDVGSQSGKWPAAAMRARSAKYGRCSVRSSEPGGHATSAAPAASAAPIASAGATNLAADRSRPSPPVTLTERTHVDRRRSTQDARTGSVVAPHPAIDSRPSPLGHRHDHLHRTARSTTRHHTGLDQPRLTAETRIRASRQVGGRCGARLGCERARHGVLEARPARHDGAVDRARHRHRGERRHDQHAAREPHRAAARRCGVRRAGQSEGHASRGDAPRPPRSQHPRVKDHGPHQCRGDRMAREGLHDAARRAVPRHRAAPVLESEHHRGPRAPDVEGSQQHQPRVEERSEHPPGTEAPAGRSGHGSRSRECSAGHGRRPDGLGAESAPERRSDLAR